MDNLSALDKFAEAAALPDGAVEDWLSLLWRMRHALFSIGNWPRHRGGILTSKLRFEQFGLHHCKCERALKI
jgi:hypothetical protein